MVGTKTYMLVRAESSEKRSNALDGGLRGVNKPHQPILKELRHLGLKQDSLPPHFALMHAIFLGGFRLVRYHDGIDRLGRSL